jgi:sodium/potassium-transporting ATPase subunit alpha
LQTLTAYFFPTVTTQIANVLCRRSGKASLFSREFMSPERRRECIRTIASWRPPRYVARVSLDYRLSRMAQIEIPKAFFALLLSLILLPVKLLGLFMSKVNRKTLFAAKVRREVTSDWHEPRIIQRTWTRTPSSNCSLG